MSIFLNRRVHLLMGVILGLSLLASCNPLQQAESEKTNKYIQNFEITGMEKEEIIGDINPAIYTRVNRSNEGAKAVSIPIVPKDGKEVQLSTGRYVVTGYPVGNIFVHDKQGELILSEIVGDYAGSSSLTIDIDSSYTIRADGGYDSVEITPVPTLLNDVLTAGVWEVGTDIAAGTYEITIGYRYGYLHILEQGKDPSLYELIGGTLGKSISQIDLKDGQILRVTETSAIEFKPVK